MFPYRDTQNKGGRGGGETENYNDDNKRCNLLGEMLVRAPLPLRNSK
jgi:hypothetical protein